MTTPASRIRRSNSDETETTADSTTGGSGRQLGEGAATKTKIVTETEYTYHVDRKEEKRRLDDVGEMMNWGFYDTICHNCKITNSELCTTRGAFMIQCARCKIAQYCSMDCLSQDSLRHSEFCQRPRARPPPKEEPPVEKDIQKGSLFLSSDAVEESAASSSSLKSLESPSSSTTAAAPVSARKNLEPMSTASSASTHKAGKPSTTSGQESSSSTGVAPSSATTTNTPITHNKLRGSKRPEKVEKFIIESFEASFQDLNADDAPIYKRDAPNVPLRHHSEEDIGIEAAKAPKQPQRCISSDEIEFQQPPSRKSSSSSSSASSSSSSSCSSSPNEDDSIVSEENDDKHNSIISELNEDKHNSIVSEENADKNNSFVSEENDDISNSFVSEENGDSRNKVTTSRALKQPIRKKSNEELVQENMEKSKRLDLKDVLGEMDSEHGEEEDTSVLSVTSNSSFNVSVSAHNRSESDNMSNSDVVPPDFVKNEISKRIKNLGRAKSVERPPTQQCLHTPYGDFGGGASDDDEEDDVGEEDEEENTDGVSAEKGLWPSGKLRPRSPDQENVAEKGVWPAGKLRPGMYQECEADDEAETIGHLRRSEHGGDSADKKSPKPRQRLTQSMPSPMMREAADTVGKLMAKKEAEEVQKRVPGKLKPTCNSDAILAKRNNPNKLSIPGAFACSEPNCRCNEARCVGKIDIPAVFLCPEHGCACSDLGCIQKYCSYPRSTNKLKIPAIFICPDHGVNCVSHSCVAKYAVRKRDPKKLVIPAAFCCPDHGDSCGDLGCLKKHVEQGKEDLPPQGVNLQFSASFECPQHGGTCCELPCVQKYATRPDPSKFVFLAAFVCSEHLELCRTKNVIQVGKFEMVEGSTGGGRGIKPYLRKQSKKLSIPDIFTFSHSANTVPKPVQNREGPNREIKKVPALFPSSDYIPNFMDADKLDIDFFEEKLRGEKKVHKPHVRESKKLVMPDTFMKANNAVPAAFARASNRAPGRPRPKHMQKDPN